MNLSPHTLALRFRIWQYAQPKGWDVTVQELATALGTSPQSIGKIAQQAGWITRLRVAPTKHRLSTHHAVCATPEEVDRLIDDIQRGLT